jgi:hypothetical protein
VVPMLSLILVAALQAPPATPAAAPAGPAAAVTVPPAADQIAAAVLAAPADRRAGAMVLGYDDKGVLVTLRPGTNDIVCLGDDPKDAKAFSVACYHKDLEPYMARGRELVAQGVKMDDSHDARWKEIDAGTLKMPKEPRNMCVISGKAFDAAAGAIAEGYTRWVIYTPYATPESTGISATPVPGGPWMMYPGKAGAHIMINPPRPPKAP